MGAAKEQYLVENVLLAPLKTGSVKPDQVLMQRPTDAGELPLGVFDKFPIKNAVASVDAAIADVNARPGNKLLHFNMALAAERAHGEVGSASHMLSRLTPVKTLICSCRL